MLMVSDEVQMIVHKKPDGGGLSAVGGNSLYTFYEPGCPEYAGLEANLMEDIPKLMEAMDLSGEPLPLLWTTDFIPKDPEDGSTGTDYVVGEFNCSCVGVSKFQAVCGGDKTMADVSDEDYFEACKLTDLIGRKAVQILNQMKTPASKPEPVRKVDFPDASPAERKALIYLKEKVDPIFAPLLRKILIERPADVAQFVISELSS